MIRVQPFCKACVDQGEENPSRKLPTHILFCDFHATNGQNARKSANLSPLDAAAQAQFEAATAARDRRRAIRPAKPASDTDVKVLESKVWSLPPLLLPILEKCAEGLNNAGIAAALSFTKGTVVNGISSIYRHLDLQRLQGSNAKRAAAAQEFRVYLEQKKARETAESTEDKSPPGPHD